ncbi:DDE-type integrase/transposase/recombinase [Micromonospora sp. NPDC093243]|uniref:DDE-type integrase/transposase/recombinase n=1 Tax=Micromonospora sp. NPDC093243 TaxID=3364290 RepID=UPI003814E05B
MLVSARRDAGAARRLFRRALSASRVTPSKVVTDANGGLSRRARRADPAWHHVEQCANNPIEADASQLKQR